MASLLGGMGGGGGAEQLSGPGAGAGAGGGGGMGGMMGGMGGGSNLDLTFGQGKVWADKVGREMQLLESLLKSTSMSGQQVTSGQSPQPAQVVRAQPFLLSFGGR